MQKMLIRYSLIGSILLFSSCQIGPSVDTYLKPNGPNAELELQSGLRVKGISRGLSRRVVHELLEINDQGLLMVASGKIVLIEYDALLSYKYKKEKLIFMRKHTPETIKSRIMELGEGSIGLLVRFPQGVSSDVLEELLAAYNQDTLIVVPDK